MQQAQRSCAKRVNVGGEGELKGPKERWPKLAMLAILAQCNEGLYLDVQMLSRGLGFRFQTLHPLQPLCRVVRLDLKGAARRFGRGGGGFGGWWRWRCAAKPLLLRTLLAFPAAAAH